MDNYQISKLGMYMVVRDYMIANAAVLVALPNFSTNQTVFQDMIAQIQLNSELQIANKTGIAGRKGQLRKVLVELAADSSRKLKAYAKLAGNQALLNEIDYSVSDLLRCADTKLKVSAQGIYDRAQPIVSSLAGYGITAATQTALQNAINAFGTAIPKPRLGITERKQATTQLGVLFKAADAALGNIDTVVEIVRVTQANFYFGYKAARKIVMTGGGSVSVKGVVRDAVTGELLRSVTLRFVPEGALTRHKPGRGTGEITKKTAAKGGFMVKRLAEGPYRVLIGKGGYREQTVSLNVSDDEMKTLDVKLERE